LLGALDKADFLSPGSVSIEDMHEAVSVPKSRLKPQPVYPKKVAMSAAHLYDV